MGRRGREESEILPEVRSGPILQECVYVAGPWHSGSAPSAVPEKVCTWETLRQRKGLAVYCVSLVVEQATWVIGPGGS